MHSYHHCLLLLVSGWYYEGADWECGCIQCTLFFACVCVWWKEDEKRTRDVIVLVCWLWYKLLVLVNMGFLCLCNRASTAPVRISLFEKVHWCQIVKLVCVCTCDLISNNTKLPSWSTMTYLDTKTNEDMPNSMACHACKIKSARIELFRKPVDVYNSSHCD